MLTGAGVSAASGVPTFRGADGLWKNFRPEALATAEAFGRDPRLVWEWYAWRRSLIAACEPNEAHRVLADWSRRFPNFKLITQNVDGLHEAACQAYGAKARHGDVIRLHGSIWEVSCWQGCATSPRRWRDDDAVVHGAAAAVPALRRPRFVPAWSGSARRSIPTSCRRRRRPPSATSSSPSARRPSSIRRRVSSTQARQHGAFTVEINPEATPATAMVDLALHRRRRDVLPEIDKRIRPRLPVV